jgi:endonuclease/exonuclease/phosphatase (EEP) superfamily protein YafD
VAAQFARLGWAAELASHFRPQYLLTAMALMAVFALMRRHLLALLAFGVALPNAWYVGPYALATVVPASEAGGAVTPVVSLVALNLNYRNDSYEAVREYLRSRQPDVLVLTELTPAWVVALEQVRAQYPYWVSLDRPTPWGLGVYSKFPLRGARTDDLGMPGSVNVIATLELPTGDVEMIAAHLASPTSPERAAGRNVQLRRIADILDGAPGGSDGTRRRLLVGDLNITPYSPYLGDLLARTGMRDARRPMGLLGTWPTSMPLVQVHIDHCIADAATGVARVSRGPAVGSDHYPLEVTLH